MQRATRRKHGAATRKAPKRMQHDPHLQVAVDMRRRNADEWRGASGVCRPDLVFAYPL